MTHLEQLAEHMAFMEVEACAHQVPYMFASKAEQAVMEGLVFNTTVNILNEMGELRRRQVLKEGLRGDTYTNNKNYMDFASKIIPILIQLAKERF